MTALDMLRQVKWAVCRAVDGGMRLRKPLAELTQDDLDTQWQAIMELENKLSQDKTGGHNS